MRRAEDITGIARGVAFQLCEALGVLERAKVAEEVKGLEQPMRATLRKYGVRFGAYHIYMPPLLKPAPRVLAMQLYALKHEGAESDGFDAVERLAASGRTSIAADKEISAALYRTAGYRVCGERAVRVDILERLADIIRPALAWRAGSPGLKPAAAFDGRGFAVTTAMTSLTGCSGEEFASILRSLGYRMEQRPKPAAPPSPPVEATIAEPPAETVTHDRARCNPTTRPHRRTPMRRLLNPFPRRRLRLHQPSVENPVESVADDRSRDCHRSSARIEPPAIEPAATAEELPAEAAEFGQSNHGRISGRANRSRTAPPRRPARR